MPSSEWHWEQGIKYAVEGIRTALLLNGAAAIALLTFTANTHNISSRVICAIALFALGAMASALAFPAAYLAQLEYGNAELPNADKGRIWEKAQRWNWIAICILVVSIALFLVGAVLAALAIKPN
jgi:hypothetical protein